MALHLVLLDPTDILHLDPVWIMIMVPMGRLPRGTVPPQTIKIIHLDTTRMKLLQSRLGTFLLKVLGRWALINMALPVAVPWALMDSILWVLLHLVDAWALLLLVVLAADPITIIAWALLLHSPVPWGLHSMDLPKI